MRRRDFLIAGVGLSPIWRSAFAQTTAIRKRIALVQPAATVEYTKADPNTGVFFDELKRRGFIEGENLAIDWYSAEGRFERYEPLTREVVDAKPDLIVTSGTPLIS